MIDDKNPVDPVEELFKKRSSEVEEAPWNEEDWLKLEPALAARSRKRVFRRGVIITSAAAMALFAFIGYYTVENYNSLQELSSLVQDELIQRGEGGDLLAGVLQDEEADSGISVASAGSALPSSSPVDEETVPVESGSGHAGDASPMTPAPQSAGDLTDSPSISQNIPVPASAGTLQGWLEGETLSLPRVPEDIRVDGAGERLDLSNRLIRIEATQTLSCNECLVWLDYDGRSVAADHTPEMERRSSDYAAARREAQMSALDHYYGMPVERMVQGDLRGFPSNGLIPLDYPGTPRTFDRPAFTIGLVASPDFSSVGSFANRSGAGYKAGLTLALQISESFSISSGILQSNVRYSAEGASYYPLSTYGQSSGTQIQMDAECLLLDIPLMLHYDLFQSGRSRLSIGAGFSSYIMNSEEYRYRIEEENGDVIHQLWSEESGSFHLFSNAGFSIGYELDILPDWSLRAEPFLRIPVKEIGWANSRLYSMGSFISLNYRLQQRP